LDEEGVALLGIHVQRLKKVSMECSCCGGALRDDSELLEDWDFGFKAFPSPEFSEDRVSRMNSLTLVCRACFLVLRPASTSEADIAAIGFDSESLIERSAIINRISEDDMLSLVRQARFLWDIGHFSHIQSWAMADAAMQFGAKSRDLPTLKSRVAKDFVPYLTDTDAATFLRVANLT
jgi:hypothetical protein